MRFDRGNDRCHVAGCREPAVLSLVTIVSTPGKQGKRLQKCSRAVRLCAADAKMIGSGTIPEEFTARLDTAIKYVTGER